MLLCLVAVEAETNFMHEIYLGASKWPFKGKWGRLEQITHPHPKKRVKPLFWIIGSESPASRCGVVTVRRRGIALFDPIALFDDNQTKFFPVVFRPRRPFPRADNCF